jgi:hypothetical protein
MECQHFLADENGKCIDCGQPVEGLPQISSEDLELIKKYAGTEHPVIFRIAPKEDLIGIIELADDTIKEYESQLLAQEDPACPGQPKMRVIGNTIFRPNWEEIWNKVVLNSYRGALMMGYRQSLSRWDEFLKDSIRLMHEQGLLSLQNNSSKIS